MKLALVFHINCKLEKQVFFYLIISILKNDQSEWGFKHCFANKFSFSFPCKDNWVYGKKKYSTLAYSSQIFSSNIVVCNFFQIFELGRFFILLKNYNSKTIKKKNKKKISISYSVRRIL